MEYGEGGGGGGQGEHGGHGYGEHSGCDGHQKLINCIDIFPKEPKILSPRNKITSGIMVDGYMYPRK